jgi:hypothetical protein
LRGDAEWNAANSHTPSGLAPGRRRWEERRGREYLIFIDETFRGFFELQQTGYFCHAAVGLPTSEYEAVKAETAPVFERYKTATALNSVEFKHSEFRRLDLAARRRIGIDLAAVLTRHGAFVAGFYTTTRDFVLEDVRTDLLFSGAEGIPDDSEKLWDASAAKIKKEFADGTGQSTAISKLLQVPAAAVTNLLAAFGCRFWIVYDPRQSKEDHRVAALLDEYMKAIGVGAKIITPQREEQVKQAFLGFDSSRPSEEQLGLQLADLLAGEVRLLFESRPEVRRFGANQRLVRQNTEEAIVTMDVLNGTLFKTGVLVRMPPGLCAAFSAADRGGRFVLPYFRNLLAAGMLTTYSSWGQPRDVMPFEGWIWDQID